MIARYPPIVVKTDPELETPEWQPTPGKRQNITVFKGSNRLQSTYDHEMDCQFYGHLSDNFFTASQPTKGFAESIVMRR